jgi:hypothetical protein
MAELVPVSDFVLPACLKVKAVEMMVVMEL